MDIKLDKPLLTIAIPTYNRAQLLAEALNSVTSQTYKDFELIVVDDGSSDTTPALIKSEAKKNQKIKKKDPKSS